MPTTSVLTALVVDDELPALSELSYLLSQDERIGVVITPSSGTAALQMLDTHGAASPLTTLRPVTDGATLTRLASGLGRVHVSPAVKGYIVDVVDATRSNTDLRLGASPRAGLHLLRAVRVRAAMHGRDYVTPDDVQALLGPVLGHRLLLTSQARLAGRKPADVVLAAAGTVPVPRGD